MMDVTSLVAKVANPLCRVIKDPSAAYMLAVLPPNRFCILLLSMSHHRDDMLAIMDAIEPGLSLRTFAEAFARIPAERLHSLTQMVISIYAGGADE